MEDKDIYSHVDHTFLKAVSSWEDIKQICQESLEYNTASVCVPPSYVARIKEMYGEKMNICTVIGFPLGYHKTENKVNEIKLAIKDGANEIDAVINIGDVKNNNFEAVTNEIKQLKEACGNKTLKIIVETCYLTEDEKIRICQCVTEGGADYIKTSTGFGTDGARLEDIELFKKHIGSSLKIKAAGGVKNRKDLEMFIEAGCQRIGTSSAVKILNGANAESY